jgi:hypothetical protein
VQAFISKNRHLQRKKPLFFFPLAFSQAINYPFPMPETPRKKGRPTRAELGLMPRVPILLRLEPHVAVAFKARAKSEGKSGPELLYALLKPNEPTPSGAR